MFRTTPVLIIALITASAWAQPTSQPAPAKVFSTAGFFALPGSGRDVFNFNPGWRFFKGDVPGAQSADFADSAWEVVSLPHGLELLPSEASGCVNYQGPAWYRKHFRFDPAMAGKTVLLHFEAIMGKSKVWLDGKQVAEHFGGYLPIVIDLSAAAATPAQDHVLAVWADNSDDPNYPPGKPQAALDFAYFGGIYRDVWLISMNPVHITDPMLADKVAGGGAFVHFDNVGEDAATVLVDTDVTNTSAAPQTIRIETTLRDAAGQSIATIATDIPPIAPGATQTVKHSMRVPKPHLWHPDDPYLHQLDSRVIAAGKTIDGFSQRIGIRSIDFRGQEGFFLNGKPFGDKLMGANHHQDFAYVGNAVPNSTQWRDAKKLRDAGMRIIRSAHYPQDPAFMDACDELGLFVIVATPGWQFWNQAPSFADFVVSDVRHMVRRDRNHPSVIMWEPILNETGYPAPFARRTYDAVHEEFPFPGCFCACDSGSSGAPFYDVLYGGLFGGAGGRGAATTPGAAPAAAGRGGRGAVPSNKSLFTREWGDNVDDWNSHNSDSRVSRGWGEEPMLIQARHYANPSVYSKPPYNSNALNSFYLMPMQHVGAALWHSFDHQRGYHPDPFWGGIMDAFRQPKYSYYMFQSNRDPIAKHPTAQSGPMLFIAHELTPFSGTDITIFTNCDEVRLSIQGQEPIVKKIDHSQPGMPHPPVAFENAFDSQTFKNRGRGGRGGGNADQPTTGNFKVVAEGLINGNVVIRTEKSQAKRAEEILVHVDNDGLSLVADGADFVPVIAEIADRNGNIRRLSEGEIVFDVQGEAAVMGDASIGANPRRIEWGSAPALIRSTLKPGTIRVTARLPYGGSNAPKPGTVELTSVAPAQGLIYTDAPRRALVRNPTSAPAATVDPATLQRELRQVERDQERFAEPNR